ncbi:hypothetical protein NE237_017069 [Protea cynaroides]|uniref:Uncharacterized protein n=1 Tax=Protea cynaroides TaxID=273540 RepID=A0A9Q0QMG4_9MAGN|nr:hypothetical protein NE237_017069 [Protea cynaroides]
MHLMCFPPESLGKDLNPHSCEVTASSAKSAFEKLKRIKAPRRVAEGLTSVICKHEMNTGSISDQVVSSSTSQFLCKAQSEEIKARFLPSSVARHDQKKLRLGFLPRDKFIGTLFVLSSQNQYELSG